MEHLTETQLNEYLDGLTDAHLQERMQAHLSDCGNCRGRLANLQAVFQALDALPEVTLESDLSPFVIESLQESTPGRGWQLVLAMQAGLGFGLLFLILPFLAGHIAGIMPGFKLRLALPEVKFPNPPAFHFGLPVITIPNPLSLALPIAITHANFDIWLILGIAAVLLFAVGNFSLIFHNASRARK
jgi:hypothetical protein